jgi:hypothetical protein
VRGIDPSLHVRGEIGRLLGGVDRVANERDVVEHRVQRLGVQDDDRDIEVRDLGDDRARGQLVAGS